MGCSGKSIATGLNRLYPDENNAANLFQRRDEILNDITKTNTLAFMSLTMGCAQCHDHKFDPFTMKDFYSLASFFAGIQEKGIYGGGNFGPYLDYITPEQKTTIASLTKQIAELQEAMKTPTPEELKAMVAWEAEMLEKLKTGGAIDFAWVTEKKTPDGKRDGAFNYIDD